MKRYKKVLLNKSQLKNHYSIVHTVIVISLIPVIILIADKIGLLSSSSLERIFNLFYLMTMPMLILAFYFYMQLKKSLRYKEVEVKCSDIEFEEALKRTTKELGLLVETTEKGYFRGYSDYDYIGIEGSMITIIKKEDFILFNSIKDPNRYTLSGSWGRNKKNYNIFLKNLRDVLKGEPEKTVVEKEQKVWSLNRILIRFVSYPFCIFLIVLGIYAQLHPINWKSGMVGTGAIVLASYYLYADLQEIISDIKKRKQKK